MYEKYKERVIREKAYSRLIPFFENIYYLFLRKLKNSDEIPIFENLPTHKVTDAPDDDEGLLKELRKYFEVKRLILFKRNADAVEMLEKEDMPDKNNPTSVLLWTVKGEALFECRKKKDTEKNEKNDKDDIDKAIDCFEEAIMTDEKYALAHLGIANALFKKYKDMNYNEDKDLKKELKAAEDLGAKAQVAEQYGYMHQQYGNKEEAISNYEKAIDWDPCMVTALRFLAPYYCDIMQTKKALNILNRAGNLMQNDDPDIDFLKGSVHLKEGGRERKYKKADEHLKKAGEYLKKAGDRYEILNDSYFHSLSKELLKEIEVDTKTREKLENNNDNPVAKILWQTIAQRIDYTVFHNQEKFLDFIAPKLSETVSHDIIFEVLRRWNSYTPIIADNYYTSRGGGYFIKIKGKGIVVDPGFNFIDNFREAGHKFNEIDAVLITHAHNDHTADIESILTLLYRYNKEFRGEKTYNREKTIRAEMAMFYNKEITCTEEDFKKDCNNAY